MLSNRLLSTKSYLAKKEVSSKPDNKLDSRFQGDMFTLEAQILVRFALRLAVSETQHVQDGQKSEMQRMTLNLTWALNSQKYSIYTKYLPLRPKF